MLAKTSTAAVWFVDAATGSPFANAMTETL
jgi:hypothetical protein